MVTEKSRKKMDRNTDALILKELHTNGPKSARELAKSLYGAGETVKRSEVMARFWLGKLIKSGHLSKTGHIYSLTGTSQYWPDVTIKNNGGTGEIQGAVLVLSPTDVRFFPK